MRVDVQHTGGAASVVHIKVRVNRESERYAHIFTLTEQEFVEMVGHGCRVLTDENMIACIAAVENKLKNRIERRHYPV